MLLSSYPSLISFNLTANEISSVQTLRRFSQWEYFIREKLPRLENFRFKISARMSRYQDFASIKSIIAAFRTSFWLQYKCWYAKFQYVINDEGSRFIISSSINGHVDFFQNFDKGFISYFTSTTKDDDGPGMRNVWNALFNLPDVMEAIGFRKVRIGDCRSEKQNLNFLILIYSFVVFSLKFQSIICLIMSLDLDLISIGLMIGNGPVHLNFFQN
jgi:hypothetical protein